MKTVYFYEVPVGAVFHMNGLRCKKKSTRTAWISEKLWFYFGRMETVRIEKCFLETTPESAENEPRAAKYWKKAAIVAGIVKAGAVS